MTSQSFKVLIVGGGPCGLVAAHALHHAGIDFTILEQHIDPFKDTGASLILSPQNLRVMHQLGLLDELLAIGAQLAHQSQSPHATGSGFKRSDTATRVLRESHGCSLTAFHRAHLVKVLYDRLPGAAKSRYLRGKRLVDIKEAPSGVVICCSDGAQYDGSIVIGADGVHSQTRQITHRLALEDSTKPPAQSSWGPASPFKAYYKCLWASFPRPSPVGDSYETQGRHRSAMYLTGANKGWIFLYEKLPNPTNERISYTDQEVQAFARSFADWPLTDGGLKVSDVLAPESSVVGLANLEEGVLETKSWNGSVVLVGDACHKFTPNSGLGFNNGVQDVVALCNRLRSLLASSTGDESSPDTITRQQRLRAPNRADLQRCFDEYEEARRLPLGRDFAQAWGAPRLSAWDTWLDVLKARYFFSLRVVQRHFAKRSSVAISQGLVLDYITVDEPFTGKVPWANPLGKPER